MLLRKFKEELQKIIEGMRDMEYGERLKRTNLLSLEMRRLRADLIEVFKIMNGLEGLKVEDFFELSGGRQTRGHSKKIYKQFSRLDVRKYFFSQRIVDEWNNLPSNIIKSKTINAFKRKIEPLFAQVRELTISRRRLPAPVLKTSSRAQ